MRRFAHYLKENKTGALPQHFICYDTETTLARETPAGKEQTLKLYTAVYHRRMPKGRKDIIKWTHGFGADGLADFVTQHTRKNTCLYIFSANIWFDLRVSKLMELLLEDTFKVKSFFSNGKCFQLIMKRGRETIKFLNIQNFWPVSVKAIGEVVGLEKIEVDFNTVSDEDLLTYCYRDCDIIYRSMLTWFDFVKSNNLGTFGITLASQAFNAYRHRFMPVKIGIHDQDRALRLERSGYFGGRTECFHIGRMENKTLYALDINSMYPFVMRSFEYPHMIKGFRKDCPLELAPEIIERFAVVAECKLDTDEPVYAKRLNHKTVFPIGRFTTTLNSGTFRYALERDHIVSIDKIALYSKADLFSLWVDEIYHLRLSYMARNDKTLTYLCKIMLNSLYGKFGQKSDELLDEGTDNEIRYDSERILDLPTGEWLMMICLGNYYKLVKLKVNEGYNSFPAIAAHVTDYARLYLWQLMKTAGQDEVFYTDTDSLYTTAAGYENLKPYLDASELGKLKLEKQSAYWHFFGCKDYIFKGRKTLKGIPKMCKRVGFRTFEYDMFPGIKTELRQGISNNYTIMKMQKTLKREYDKGIIHPSGKVYPFLLAEF